MNLWVLGTQGWVPTARRATTCFAIEDGPRLLIFDAGTGIGRLVAPPYKSLLERCTEVHLFLTHYHLDHTCGLAYLPALFPERGLTIHAPAKELSGFDPRAALAELIRPPYNPRPFADISGVTIDEVLPGEQEIAGHRIRVRVQQHTQATLGYRLDDALVLATDTVIDPETAVFAQGAGLLLHEAWYSKKDGHGVPASLAAGFAAHSEATAAADLAAQAEVGRLLFMHLNPLFDEAYYAMMAAHAAEVFPATAVPADGDVVELAGA